MSPADLRPDMHLRGTLCRVVDGAFIEFIPVVHRVRQIRRMGQLAEVHVTWTTGGRGVYLPTEQVFELVA